MINVLPYLRKRWAAGFNCWDFVRLIYEEQFQIELCQYAVNSAGDIREACKAVEAESVKAVWQEISLPEENAIMLLGNGGLRWHVGFMVTPARVIHLMDKGGVIVQDTATLKSQFPNFKFFRHAHFSPCHESAETVRKPDARTSQGGGFNS